MTNRSLSLLTTRASRALLALAAVAALGGASLAQAQPVPASGPAAHAGHPGMGPQAGQPGQPRQPWQGGPGRMGGLEPAQVQQHLAQVKQALKITPDQEGAWQNFAGFATRQAEALRIRHADRETEMLNRRLKEVQARKEGKPVAGPTAPEQLASGVDRAKQHVADLEALSGAVKSLYAVLTPEQRKLADQHFARLHGRRMHGMHHGMGHGGPEGGGMMGGHMHGPHGAMGHGPMGAGPAQ